MLVGVWTNLYAKRKRDGEKREEKERQTEGEREGEMEPIPSFSCTLSLLPSSPSPLLLILGGCTAPPNAVQIFDLEERTFVTAAMEDRDPYNRQISLLRHTVSPLVIRPDLRKVIDGVSCVGVTLVTLGGGSLCFSFGTHLNPPSSVTLWVSESLLPHTPIHSSPLSSSPSSSSLSLSPPSSFSLLSFSIAFSPPRSAERAEIRYAKSFHRSTHTPTSHRRTTKGSLWERSSSKREEEGEGEGEGERSE